MSDGWYSKQDAIKDLSIAAGKRAPDFSEEYVIIGERPPPRRWTPDDEEMEESLRFLGNHSSHESNQPDLQGITEMLRMYDEFNNSSNAKESETDNVVLSISKLNPNISEFVPRTSCNNNNVNKPEEIQNVNESSNVNKVTNKTDTCDSNKILVNGVMAHRIDVSRLKPEEIKDMKEKLKTKITDTSNTTCVKAKRERNLAIASLVKLHCRSPVNITENNLKPPDYFTRSLSEQAERDVKKENVTNTTDGGLAHSKVNSPQVKQNEVTKECEIEMKKVTKDVSDSIQRVEEWLHPKKRKEITPKNVYLGPITFKRKVGKPQSLQSTESDAPSNVSSGEVFVPSAFASKLTKEYEERLKVKETPPDMWTKLQADLKVRDEIIKKQRLQQKHSINGYVNLPDTEENIDN